MLARPEMHFPIMTAHRSEVPLCCAAATCAARSRWRRRRRRRPPTTTMMTRSLVPRARGAGTPRCVWRGAASGRDRAVPKGRPCCRCGCARRAVGDLLQGAQPHERLAFGARARVHVRVCVRARLLHGALAWVLSLVCCCCAVHPPPAAQCAPLRTPDGRRCCCGACCGAGGDDCPEEGGGRPRRARESCASPEGPFPWPDCGHCRRAIDMTGWAHADAID